MLHICLTFCLAVVRVWYLWFGSICLGVACGLLRLGLINSVVLTVSFAYVVLCL